MFHKNFYGFSTLSKNHDPSRNLIKASCRNEEIKRRALQFEINIPIGEHTKILFTEPRIKPVMQCLKCKIFGHKVVDCLEMETCAQCGSQDHKEADCLSPKKKMY